MGYKKNNPFYFVRWRLKGEKMLSIYNLFIQYFIWHLIKGALQIEALPNNPCVRCLLHVSFFTFLVISFFQKKISISVSECERLILL